jgi:hypothetical protein
MESVAENGNEANTLVGALWASRSVGEAMLDVQNLAIRFIAKLLARLTLIKRRRGRW